MGGRGEREERERERGIEVTRNVVSLFSVHVQILHFTFN